MKVLYVINSLNIGGAEMLLGQMAPKFRAVGVSVDIALLCQATGAIVSELKAEGIKILSPERGSMYSAAHVLRFVESARDYDIVHSHLFPSQLWVSIASYVKPSVPVVTTEHSTRNRRRVWCAKPIEKLMYSRYKKIICVSRAVQESFSKWLPELAHRTIVIPNGIDIDRFSSATACSKEEVVGVSDCPVIVTVGRLQPVKGHDVLIKAMQLIPDAHLVIVGTGSLRNELAKLAESVGVSSRVHFVGETRRVAELLKMADVYVHPARWEGFGLAVLEAMAAGLPVVTTAIPSLLELVGDAGLAFREGDWRHLAEVVNNLIVNREDLASVGAKCYARAQDYSLLKTIQAHISLYEEIVSATHL